MESDHSMKHRNKIHQTSFTRFKQGTNARGKVQKRHHKWNTEATHAPINPAARDMEVDAAHVLASGHLVNSFIPRQWLYRVGKEELQQQLLLRPTAAMLADSFTSSYPSRRAGCSLLAPMSPTCSASRLKTGCNTCRQQKLEKFWQAPCAVLFSSCRDQHAHV